MDMDVKNERGKQLIVRRGGCRVDVWLAQSVPGVSRRAAAREVEAGRVLVNGHRVRKGWMLSAGEMVDVRFVPRGDNWSVRGRAGTGVNVVYECDDFVVVDKPWGIPSTALSPDDTGALANRVVAMYPECAIVGAPGDGGLLQRLDVETSGVVMAARSEAVHRELRLRQRHGGIAKYYRALVDGMVNRGTRICEPLGPVGRGRHKVGVRRDGRLGVTEVVESVPVGDRCLVTVKIHRGMRHQIRAHLAHIGHPICGDTLYGKDQVTGLSRLFLHAERLEFVRQRDAETVLDFYSPLPDELACWITVD